MLNIVRDYLVSLPNPTTSPLYLAVNTSQVLTNQGSATSVTIIDTDAGNRNTPYIRIYEKPEEFRVIDRTLTGGGTEARILIIECNANGSTVSEAESRVEDLILVVDAKLNVLKGTITAGALSRTDPNGGSAYDQVVNWFVLPGQAFRTGGPGPNPGTPLWLAKRTLKLEVWINKIR